MHEHVLHVVQVWSLVSVCAETDDAFFVHIAFDPRDSFDDDVESNIKLPALNQQGVLDIPLDQVLMCKSSFWQIGKLTSQRDPFTATASRRFANESLGGVLAHMQLKILNLIRQQKTIRHESVILRVEPLKSRNNDTKDVLFCKMLNKIHQFQ